jgi:predicted oxidoreductase
MINPLKEDKLIQGLMGLWKIKDEKSLSDLIHFDLESGINFFDIADIYSNGECESKLGQVLKDEPGLRDKMIIQTKCGLRRVSSGAHENYFDLSYQHIKEATDNSLKRMNTDHVDYLLLHRPDILIDNKEVAKAFKELKQEGKVLHFGVSNFSPEAIEYLKQEVKEPLVINQLQLGLGHLELVREPMNTNIESIEGTPYSSDLFFYLKRNKMTLQCWSPNSFGPGFGGGTIYQEPKMAKALEAMKQIGDKYHLGLGGVASAFLVQLGDNVQIVTGSISPEHLQDELAGTKTKLTREEFYQLYKATDNLLP